MPRNLPITEARSGSPRNFTQLWVRLSPISPRVMRIVRERTGRIFEYALGSTRESIAWFRSGEPLLGAEVVAQRTAKLDEIRRKLMAIIPRERDRLIRPSRR